MTGFLGDDFGNYRVFVSQVGIVISERKTMYVIGKIGGIKETDNPDGINNSSIH